MRVRVDTDEGLVVTDLATGAVDAPARAEAAIFRAHGLIPRSTKQMLAALRVPRRQARPRGAGRPRARARVRCGAGNKTSSSDSGDEPEPEPPRGGPADRDGDSGPVDEDGPR